MRKRQNKHDVRLRKLRALIEERFKGRPGHMADEAKMKRPHVYRLFMEGEHRRDIGDNMARDIEKRLNLPPRWLDIDEADIGGSSPIEAKEVSELLNLLTPTERQRYIDALRALAKENRNVSGFRDMPISGISLASKIEPHKPAPKPTTKRKGRTKRGS